MTRIYKPEELLTPEVVQMLGTLHECKGRQDLYVKAKADVLTQLLEVAKIQSTGASNRIEESIRAMSDGRQQV